MAEKNVREAKIEVQNNPTTYLNDAQNRLEKAKMNEKESAESALEAAKDLINQTKQSNQKAVDKVSKLTESLFQNMV